MILIAHRVEEVATFNARIVAGITNLLNLFALSRPPEDVARLRIRLETDADLATAYFAASLEGPAAATLTSALQRASDELLFNTLLANEQASFDSNANAAINDFRASVGESNGLFMLVLHLSGVNFINSLSARLQGPNPPSDEERDFIVSQNVADRAQVVQWTMDSVTVIGQTTLARKDEANTALLLTFDEVDLLTYRMAGQTIDAFYNA